MITAAAQWLACSGFGTWTPLSSMKSLEHTFSEALGIIQYARSVHTEHRAVSTACYASVERAVELTVGT